MAFRGTATADTNFDPNGCLDGCGKLSLADAATKIAWAMAGFETGSRSNFSPYCTSAWQGQAKTNCNPLNLHGINGHDLQYTSPEAGFAAAINDIEHKIMGFTISGIGPSSTLTDLVNVWSPPCAQGNSQESTDNYVQFVADQTGLDPNAPFETYIEVSL